MNKQSEYILILFDSIEKAENAAREFGKRDIKDIEIISSFPSDNRKSSLGLIAFIGAVAGFMFSTAFIYWTSANYPLLTSQMDFFSIMKSIPIIFEITALCSVLALVVAFLFKADLPDYSVNFDVSLVPPDEFAVAIRSIYFNDIKEVIEQFDCKILNK